MPVARRLATNAAPTLAIDIRVVEIDDQLRHLLIVRTAHGDDTIPLEVSLTSCRYAISALFVSAGSRHTASLILCAQQDCNHVPDRRRSLITDNRACAGYPIALSASPRVYRVYQFCSSPRILFPLVLGDRALLVSSADLVKKERASGRGGCSTAHSPQHRSGGRKP
jgi:hypothetical protein